MKIIKLSKGQNVQVDDRDFEYLNQWRWYLDAHGYAIRRPYIKGSGRKNQKCKTIRMHRLINKTPDGFQTDHIDRNPLNNQRANLRTVTSSQNKFNLPVKKNNTSGCTGVTWDKQTSKWRAQIALNSKHISLGRFENLEEASNAYKKAKYFYHII